MEQKETNQSLFTKFWSKIHNKQIENNDFDSQIEILKSFMSKKDWKKSFKIIDKLIHKEKTDTLLLLKDVNDEEKEKIKKSYLDKLNLLIDYEKDIKNSIRKTQEEKAVKVVDNKIIYTKNRIDFYSKNENFKKALEILNNFYEIYKEDEKAIAFYNKEKAILDILVVWKKSFWGSLFWKKPNDSKKEIEVDIKNSSDLLVKEKSEESVVEVENQIQEQDNEAKSKQDVLENDINEDKNNNKESIEKNEPEKKEVKLWIKMEGINDLSLNENNKKQEELISEESSKLVSNNNLKGVLDKIEQQDSEKLDKVINLVQSLSNVEDIDKIISTVEKIDNKENSLNIIPQNNNNSIDKENIIVAKENKENVIEEVKKEENTIKPTSLFGVIKSQEVKKIDVETIVDFEWAIKWITFFINTKDWEKAKLWIEEVRKKEEKAFYLLYDKIDLEKEKKKQKDLYSKKVIQIDKLADKLEKQENIYIQEQEIEKFKVKFKQIKKKLDELIWSKKYYESMELINSFFEENKEIVVVIKFYNKWKNIIQKKIKAAEIKKDKEISKNIRKEAEILIWENINFGNDNINNADNVNNTSKTNFFSWFFSKINLYKRIKNKLKEKQLIDEVTLLIDTQNEVDELSKKSKLESMHNGLIKEIDNDRLLWYDLFAKILWKDKISGDTFWFTEDDTTYKFFLWDATWHGIQAGLIVTLLTRLFHKFSKNNFLEKVVFEINNWLKQDLKSWNFITGIFFEIDKTNLDNMKYVWMWHEPILIFRKSTLKVEKLVAWWLAAWIRLISSIDQVKNRNIKLLNWDIIFVYSDWIVESRNMDRKLLGVDWLSAIVEKQCINFVKWKIVDLYNSIIEDVKSYRWWSTNFFDDATIFIMKRNTDKDLLDRDSVYLKDLTMREWLSRKNIHELEWKTKEEIEQKLQKIRREKQLKLVISNLEKLYITWEVLKLKQESIRYIKEWFIHKKINWFLKKAISNERQYKINLKSQKMKSKYAVLRELLKKGDYNTVIKEANEIIASDWNITI